MPVGRGYTTLTSDLQPSHGSRISARPLAREANMPEDQPANTPPDAAAQASQLEAARAELNRIDDAIHALLMERAEVVKSRVGTSGKSSPLRPGRQAAVIRRLLAKHQGPLPPKNLVCLWLELMAGGTAIQGDLVAAVCEPDPQSPHIQLAREYFGALVRIRAHSSPAQALADVSAGRAAIAVLPVPAEGEGPREAWWTALMQRDDPRIHVIARLPLWQTRAEGTPRAQALVVGTSPPDASGPDASGADRGLIGLECPPDLSRARLAALLEAAGLKPTSIISRREAGLALVEVDGLLTDDDPRLKRLDQALRRPVVLGAYAVGVGNPT